MNADHSTDWPRIEQLSRDECLHLLRLGVVGRVGIVDGGRPVVLPVNYAVDGDTIVFCSAPGTKLASAAHREEVAFEVDHADPHVHSGWSVLALGRASVIRDPDELALARGLPLRPWFMTEHAHWIRVRIESVTGRRLTSPADP